MTEKVNQETQLIPLEIPEELVRSADFVGELTGLDRCAMLLYWLQAGAEREMLQLVSDGKLSTGKFVHLLGVTYWDYHPMREKYGIELGCDEQVLDRMKTQVEAVGESLSKSIVARKEQE